MRVSLQLDLRIPLGFLVECHMKPMNRHSLAAWMFVPLILFVPALVSGLSIWNQWGPQWLLLSIALAVALLAVMVDFRRAWRWALVGGALGLVTSPLLLLFARPDWTGFGWWIAIPALMTALIVPLVWEASLPPHKSHAASTGAASVPAGSMGVGAAGAGTGDINRERLAGRLPQQ
jgi:hypothetical protein